MPRKPSTRARPNGFILTAKNVPERVYMTIHSLPRGMRGPVLQEALRLVQEYKRVGGKDWHKEFIAGMCEIQHTRQ